MFGFFKSAKRAKVISARAEERANRKCFRRQFRDFRRELNSYIRMGSASFSYFFSRRVPVEKVQKISQKLIRKGYQCEVKIDPRDNSCDLYVNWKG